MLEKLRFDPILLKWMDVSAQWCLFGWVLHLDRAATHAVYAARPLGSGCDCTYCRNFTVAARYMPSDVSDLLRALDIDPLKPVTVSATSDSPDHAQFYAISYALVGTIRADSSIMRQPSRQVQLTEDFTFAIRESMLPSHDFPEPVVQVDCFGHLPWLLVEPPEQYP